MPIDPRWGAVTLAAWLLSYAAQSTLLLGCLALLSRWRKLPAGLEQTLWKTALLGSLITATVVALGWDGGLGARIHLAPSSPASGLVPWSGMTHPAATSWSAQLPALRTWLVLAAWALTGFWGLLRLATARRRLEAQLCRRRALESGPHREALDHLRRSAGIRRSIRLTVSSCLGSPIAIGDDEICLPERALTDLRPEELQSALAHELAHLARRDPGWKGFAAGLGAVFFFQPLLRIARRRLDETAEYLADDWAVRHSGGEISLARCLAAVAGWQTPRFQTVAAAGMADGASPLLRRVERLLGGRPEEPGRVWCYAGALLLLLGGWMFAPGVTTQSRASGEPKLLSMPTEIYERSAPEPMAPETEPGVRVVPRERVRLRHPGLAMMRHALPPEPGPAPEMGRAPESAELPPMLDRVPDSTEPPLLDRDTAPPRRVIFIPHEAIQARIEVLRALSRADNLDPQTARALLEVEHKLMELEMAQRGVQILWMVEPPAPPGAPAPPAPPASPI